jgi:hypothetical protein
MSRPLPLGHALLDDLASEMSPEEIARYLEDYGAVTGYDVAFRQLLQTADGQVDLREKAHRAAVVSWLRTWGCRHLRRADGEQVAEALGLWWDSYESELPSTTALLTHLDEPALRRVERAFESLRATQAAGWTAGGKEVELLFCDTAAAKTLFIVRPLAFLPWDEATRLAFGWWGGGLAYAELLRLAGAALDNLAARLGVPAGDLPAELGRAGSSPAKLVDEFLWVRISREV